MTEAGSKTQSRILAILSSLDDVTATACDNRRSNARMSFRHDMRIVLLPSTGDTKQTIHTRNLSPSGLGFLCRKPFEKGDRFVLPIKMSGTASKLVLCRVTFCRYVSAGLYAVGCEFEKSVLDPREENVIPAEWADLALLKTAGLKPTEQTLNKVGSK